MRDRFELARTLIDALRRRFEILQHMAPVDCFVPEEKIIFSKWFGSEQTSITFYRPFFMSDCMAGCKLIEIAKFDFGTCIFIKKCFRIFRAVIIIGHNGVLPEIP